MDFDDLLMVTANLLSAFDDVRQSYQERFRHILVDEYQDTNRAQNEIVIQLGREHANVCVVGDSDQSVYKWRGADIRNILEFETAFSGSNTTTVLLEQNFRSTQVILDAANAVITNNLGRRSKNLFTDGDTGELIGRYRAQDERDEASWVAAEILRLKAAESLSWGDIAVFYRTNAQSRAIEDALVFSGIPYKVIGGAKFYDRREIRDILAYIRVLTNPADEISARRIINVPKRGIGSTSLATLTHWARAANKNLTDAIDHADQTGISGKALRGAQQLSATLAELRAQLNSNTPSNFIHLVAEHTGYLGDLVAEHSHESQSRIENIAELEGVAAEFDTVIEFLETISLTAASDEIDDDDTRVSLMTLHTAKGLEFPAVFLIGMEEGIFPHFRSMKDTLELEEERRLCYVGITRARRHLYLSHAWERSLWGQSQHNAPSRFLTEIPARLVQDVGLVSNPSNPSNPSNVSSTSRPSGPAVPYVANSRPNAGYGVRPSFNPKFKPISTRNDYGYENNHGYENDFGYETNSTFSAQVSAAKSSDSQANRPHTSTGAEKLGLVKGDEIIHDHWGKGVVISTKGDGSKAQAVVRFPPPTGDKNLLLSATPLRRA